MEDCENAARVGGLTIVSVAGGFPLLLSPILGNLSASSAIDVLVCHRGVFYSRGHCDNVDSVKQRRERTGAANGWKSTGGQKKKNLEKLWRSSGEAGVGGNLRGPSIWGEVTDIFAGSTIRKHRMKDVCHACSWGPWSSCRLAPGERVD